LIVKEGYEKLDHQSRSELHEGAAPQMVLRQVRSSHSEVIVATRLSLGFHHAAYLFMAKQQPARFLIIAAHGVQAVGKTPFPPDGRAFHFYGPLGSTITVPPIEDVLKQERTYDLISKKSLSPAHAYEIVETEMVENYEIGKYAGSQNKLGITYHDFHADLDVHDPEGEFHVFSVSRRFKGMFGMGDMLLSNAVTLAENWNKLKYERVYCMFCRGIPGRRPRKVRDPGHTYLDNLESDIKIR
jgi:hypothetical protein